MMGSNLVNFNKVTEQAKDEQWVPCPKCSNHFNKRIVDMVREGLRPDEDMGIGRSDACGLCLGERRVKEMAATVYRLAGQEGVKDLAESE